MPATPILGWAFDAIRITDKFAALDAWLVEEGFAVTWVTRTVHTQIAFRAAGLRAVSLLHVIAELGEPKPSELDDAELGELFRYDEESGRTIVETRDGARAIAAAWSHLLDRVGPRLVLNLNGIPGVSATLTALARRRDLPVYFLENGLLPDTLVFDREGVNAGAHFVEGKWREGGTLREEEIATAARRREALSAEARTVLEHGASLSVAELRTRLEIPDDHSITLVPMQVESDTNIIRYSPQVSLMRALVEGISAAHEASGALTTIVFKEHPKRAPEGDPALARAVGEKNRYVHDLALPSLFAAAERVVCINSTVGLEGILHGKAVATLGRSTFAAQGLTTDLADSTDWRAELARFLSSPLEEVLPPAAEVDRFFAYLFAEHLFPLQAGEDSGGFRARWGDRLRQAAGEDIPTPAHPEPLAYERAGESLTEVCSDLSATGRVSIAGSGGGPTAAVLLDWWRARYPAVALELPGSTPRRWQTRERRGASPRDPAALRVSLER